MYVDTHAHLYLEQFSEDIDEVILRAQNIGVTHIMLPDIDSSTTQSLLDLSERYPELCYPMIGLHPCSVKQDYKAELDLIVTQLEKRQFYGIGETGIDLFWDRTYKEEQISSFEFQIGLALEYDLPIIIHSRDALDITIRLITKHQNGSLQGIFHCFNGTLDQCKQIEDVGFKMGLGGVITFKKANMGEVVAGMSPESIVLETDAPYLSPTPKRGKRNESSYLEHIAEKAAIFRNMETKDLIDLSSQNALELFRLRIIDANE